MKRRLYEKRKETHKKRGKHKIQKRSAGKNKKKKRTFEKRKIKTKEGTLTGKRGNLENSVAGDREKNTIQKKEKNMRGKNKTQNIMRAGKKRRKRKDQLKRER